MDFGYKYNDKSKDFKLLCKKSFFLSGFFVLLQDKNAERCFFGVVRKMKYIIYYIILSLFFSLTACKDASRAKLEIAARVVDSRPDSAYVLLREIDYNDFDADSLKAKYILTKAFANVRIGRSLITDTLLDDAAAFYLSAGDTANWVIASQLLSGYEFVNGNTEQAIHRLEEMIPLINNHGLLWDTYLHLLEVSVNSQKYANAYNYADWLFKHTDVPEQRLKFTSAKSAAQYMQGNYQKALALYDSIIGTGIAKDVSREVADEFYGEYAEILDGAGYSSRAIAIMDSIYPEPHMLADVDKVVRNVSLAQFHANSGNFGKAKGLLDSINHDATQSVFEIYAYIGMLKTAMQFKESGRLPLELMHNVTKTIHRNYRFAQFDRQTAMESVIELNDDNYKLKLQRQRLWLLVSVFSFVIVLGGIIAYFLLDRRKRRMIEAEERAEALMKMLDDAQKTDSTGNDKLKAALLRQLGIFKTFAGAPTQQSIDALKRISAVGNHDNSEALVDWAQFYAMIDDLYDGFHSKLEKKYHGIFNDKEQQIIVLLKAGFSTKEIGVLSEQSSATIYTRKSVIRKKVGSPENGDFIAMIEAQIRDI